MKLQVVVRLNAGATYATQTPWGCSPEGRVRSLRVAFDPPRFDRELGVGQTDEPVLVQARLAERAVEGLDERHSCSGLPGSMKSSSTPYAKPHASSAFPANSGPLSHTMAFGSPRVPPVGPRDYDARSRQRSPPRSRALPACSHRQSSVLGCGHCLTFPGKVPYSSARSAASGPASAPAGPSPGASATRRRTCRPSCWSESLHASC